MSKELLSTPNTLHYTTLHCNFSLLDSWDLGGAAHHPHSRSRSGGDAAALRARAGRSQSCDEDEQPALLPRLGSLRKPKRSCILGSSWLHACRCCTHRSAGCNFARTHLLRRREACRPSFCLYTANMYTSILPSLSSCCHT